MVKRTPTPSVSRLNELLFYDKDSGSLKWRRMKPGVNSSMEAGSFCRGYVVVRIDGTLYQAHRLIGLFNSFDDAVIAMKRARDKLHGEFARVA